MSARTAAPVTPAEQRFRDDEFEALPRWRRGELVPHRITLLLDANALYGPEVDQACGAAEPAVDEWEAGTRYPEWSQLIALARLVDASPLWFFGDVEPVSPRLFLCDRSKRVNGLTVVEPAPVVTGYPEDVWRPVVEHWGQLW